MSDLFIRNSQGAAWQLRNTDKLQKKNTSNRQKSFSSRDAQGRRSQGGSGGSAGAARGQHGGSMGAAWGQQSNLFKKWIFEQY